MTKFVLLGSSLVSLLLLGCPKGECDGDSACAAPLVADAGPDVRSCGCPEDEHCSDPATNKCDVGCLSDADCGTRFCHIPSGQPTGYCLAYSYAALPACATACDRTKVCGAPRELLEQCGPSFCGDTSDACRLCVATASCTDINACKTECGVTANFPATLGAKCLVGGAKCENDLECVPFASGTEGVCTQACSSLLDCPRFWSCSAQLGRKVCRPNAAP